MFWTIFTVLLIAAIVGFIIGITDYSREWLIIPSFMYLLFGTLLWLMFAGSSEVKVSDKQEVCFRQPFPTPQAIYIYTNDGAELKGNSMEDMYFPFGQAKCYKRMHYNHYGSVIKTSYTFKTEGNCKQSRTFYVE